MMDAKSYAVLLLPFVTALHYFSVTYGYKGKPHRESIRGAVQIFIITVLLELIYLWAS